MTTTTMNCGSGGGKDNGGDSNGDNNDDNDNDDDNNDNKDNNDDNEMPLPPCPFTNDCCVPIKQPTYC